MRSATLSILGVLSLPFALAAHPRSEEHAAALPAHEHGSAELMLAIEGGIIELELRLAGMDAVGFERPPADDVEREAIAGALATLEGAAWLAFETEAACTLERSSFHTHGFYADRDAEQGRENHAELGHAEFHGTLRYACLAPERLRSLAIDLASRFPAVTTLKVTVLAPAGQSQHALSGGRGSVPLEGR